ncbi:MAG: hypothetical protein SFX18_04605 [Pirellulales bacterium]|nr:hypothetical protein [Pirellulales bacterium]
MKTAVSIPDDLFASVELLVRKYGISRSQLYSRALAEFVSRHDIHLLTEQINRAVDNLHGHVELLAPIDDFTKLAAAKTLHRVEW